MPKQEAQPCTDRYLLHKHEKTGAHTHTGCPTKSSLRRRRSWKPCVVIERRQNLHLHASTISKKARHESTVQIFASRVVCAVCRQRCFEVTIMSNVVLLLEVRGASLRFVNAYYRKEEKVLAYKLQTWKQETFGLQLQVGKRLKVVMATGGKNSK